MSFLKSFLFKEEEETPKKEVINTANPSVPVEKSTPIIPTVEARNPDIFKSNVPIVSISSGTITPSYFNNEILDQKIYDMIHEEVLIKDTPFCKFVELFNKMKKIIPNEKQRLAAVMESLETNSSILIESLNTTHNNKLVEIKKDFNQEIEEYININIKDKEIVLDSISKELASLQTKMEELSLEQKEVYDSINDNKFKVDKKKNDFNYAFNYETQILEKWHSLIKSYVPIDSDKEIV